MNNYSFFRYITSNSKVHLMNSKMKVIWMLFSFILLIFMRDYLSCTLLFMVIAFVVSKTKIKLSAYIANTMALWPVYIITFILTFFITFDILFSVFITIKSILAVVLFIILTFTTSLSEIAWGFECLFIKLKKVKIPVSKISLRIAFSIKFISTLFEQAKEVRKSMAYRGIPYKSGFLSFQKMFFPVVRLSYKLSLRTISAMKLRFYGASKVRTNYHENKASRFDKSLIFINIIISYVGIWMGWIR